MDSIDLVAAVDSIKPSPGCSHEKSLFVPPSPRPPRIESSRGTPTRRIDSIERIESIQAIQAIRLNRFNRCFSWDLPQESLCVGKVATTKRFLSWTPPRRLCSWGLPRADYFRGTLHENNLFVGRVPARRICSHRVPQTEVSRGISHEISCTWNLPRTNYSRRRCYKRNIPVRGPTEGLFSWAFPREESNHQN